MKGEGSYRVQDFGSPEAEIRRLAAQAKLPGADENEALAKVGLPTTGVGLEIGCGPGFFARNVLASRPGARVLGLDFDGRALSEAAKQLTVVRGAAETLPFSNSSFDFCYSRLVLRHVRDPHLVLAEQVRVVRPGGCVAAIDSSDSSLLLDPEPEGFAAIVSARQRWFSERGADANIGHRLPRLLRQAGLRDVQICTLVVTSAGIGVGPFAQVVIKSFLDAAEKASPNDAQIESATAAAEEWGQSPHAFGAIFLLVAGGERAP
jgi:SAM-dependent methyltransferase